MGQRYGESRNKTMLHEEISATANNKVYQNNNVFSTFIYEVSCVLAFVRSIRLDLEEKLLTYRAVHNNM